MQEIKEIEKMMNNIRYKRINMHKGEKKRKGGC